MIDLVWRALVPAVHIMNAPKLVAQLADFPWLRSRDDVAMAALVDHPDGQFILAL